MSAPFRIKTSAPKTVREAGEIRAGSGGAAVALAPSIAVAPSDGINTYLDKLIKMIPTEVVGLYLVGNGIVPATQTGYLLAWTVFCLIAVVVVRVLGTRDVQAKKPPQWAAVAISTIAFIIWIYSLGGVFKVYLGNSYQPFLGSLLVLAWTFIVPFFYNPATE